jgi:hypothetical protein
MIEGYGKAKQASYDLFAKSLAIVSKPSFFIFNCPTCFGLQ